MIKNKKKIHTANFKVCKILVELWHRNEKKREFDVCDSWLPRVQLEVEAVIIEATGLHVKEFYKLVKRKEKS